MTKSFSNERMLADAIKTAEPTSPIPVEKSGKPHFKEIVPPGMGLARTPTEASEYIAEMLVVLCNMAKDVDLMFLNYLLVMAYEESMTRVIKAPVAVKSTSR